VEEIIINTGNAYPVIIGNAFSEMEQRLNSDECILITDCNVFEIYSKYFESYKTIIIQAGEKSKTWDTIKLVYKELIKLDASRNTIIIGFGGGVVCDIAGFVADTFMRGCRLGLIATSLLAQVDAAIGGKNGFNFEGIKNLIGTFKQPEFVVCDPELLKTLPFDELKSGIGEIVKYALIADPELFNFLNRNAYRILDIQSDVYEYLLESCVHIKAGFIEQDETDRGMRHHLNFGHTFGHAIEQIENIPHGIAVVKGMLISLRLSSMLNISKTNLYHNVIKVLDKLNLPIEFELNQSILAKIHEDKKKQNKDEIRIVLLREIGATELYDIRFEDLENMIETI
jgi:3-dehydroquinate synthase